MAWNDRTNDALLAERNFTRIAPVPIASPGTPVRLADSDTFAVRMEIQAGRATAANTGMVSIGANKAYTSDLQMQLAPGDTYVYQAPERQKFDVGEFYIDGATASDAVRVRYVPA